MESRCSYVSLELCIMSVPLLVLTPFPLQAINPITLDSWDAGPWYWNGGVDKPFLKALFTHLQTGARGQLDLARLTIRGYSSGAQMISWLFEVFANPIYSKAFVPKGVVLKGGVMFSGGSYQCYR